MSTAAASPSPASAPSREAPAPQTPALVAVTPALLTRLDRPVPRYTSFPTADRFVDIDERVAADALARADADVDRALSLYVHIPFCAQMCTYCGCAVVASRRTDVYEDYVGRVMREADLVAARLPHRRRVREMHFGGGTPNSLAPALLQRLVDHLRGHFAFDKDAELSIELDPRRVEPGQLAALRAMGFSRVSFGVQDTDDGVQEAIGRVQPIEVTRRAVDDARAAGFASVNVDLVYGLPRQTRESFLATIADVIALKPDRVALFSFAYVPHVRPNQKKIDAASLPPSSTKLDLFCDARAAFLDAGYVAIGMDHFARPGDPLARAFDEGRLSRSFQGYAVAADDRADVDVIGLGHSAISDIGGAYFQNAKQLLVYESGIDAGHLPVERGAVLTADALARRFAIRSLMCRFRLDDATFFAATGRRLADYPRALERLREVVDDGLARIDADGIVVTDLGRLFVRVVAAVFDDHVEVARRGSLPVWSRGV